MPNRELCSTGEKGRKVKVIIFSLISGFVIGVVFRVIGLPVPVPKELAGIVGIFGMFLGAFFAEHIFVS